jgi:hypothetical protein
VGQLSLHTEPSDAFVIKPFAPMEAGDLVHSANSSKPPAPPIVIAILAIQLIVANSWQNLFGQSDGKIQPSGKSLALSDFPFFDGIWA